MRKQPYPIIQLTGGLDVSIDPVFLADKNSPELMNIRFDKGLIKKGLGWDTFGTVHASGLPLQGQVMLIDEFPLYSGSLHYLMTTVDFPYRYIPTTGYYQNLGDDSGSDLITNWTNVNYDTFTDSGGEITSAIYSTTGSQTATSDAATLVTNKWYHLVVTLTLASGQAPTLTGTGGVTTTTLSNGANYITFKATGTSCVLTMKSTAASNYTCIFDLKLVEEFTGDEDNQFCSAVVLDSAGKEWYVLTNGKDDIKKWDGDTAGHFTDLLGWKAAGYFARQLIYFKDRLIAGFTNEGGIDCPTRIRWSIAGDVEDVTGTGSGFIDLVETSDWIVKLTVLRDKCFVVKERSIWELVYEGGTVVFTPVIRIDGVGSFSPNGVLSLGEQLVIYGCDDFYLYDGIDLTSIGKNIYPYLYSTIDRIVNGAMANRFPSAYIEELKHFVICCAPAEGTIPNVYLTYSFDYEAWTKRTKEVTAFGFYSIPSGTIWSDLVGTWANQTWVWAEKLLSSGAPTTLIGDSSGYIYEDDGLTTSTDYMCYVTKDFIFEHASRWAEFRVIVKGGVFTICYSTDGGSTWSASKSFAAQSDWTEFTHPLNVTSQRIRFKIESTATSLEIKWIEPWYIPRKRSTTLTTS